MACDYIFLDCGELHKYLAGHFISICWPGVLGRFVEIRAGIDHEIAEVEVYSAQRGIIWYLISQSCISTDLLISGIVCFHVEHDDLFLTSSYGTLLSRKALILPLIDPERPNFVIKKRTKIVGFLSNMIQKHLLDFKTMMRYLD